MFLVDSAGNLLFYNEPAEELLGHRYEETGQMPLAEWGTIFSPTDSLGRPMPPDDLPLARALADRTPAQGSFFIRGLDGISRHLSVTAVPLEGPGGTDLGALAIFWALPRR
jgi:PAS domain-containing protein